MELTKEIYTWIENEIKAFKIRTYDGNDVTVEEVLYSYLFSTDESFYILNDWDEGDTNDPYWDYELNEHSVIVFLKTMCVKLNEINKKPLN